MHSTYFIYGYMASYKIMVEGHSDRERGGEGAGVVTLGRPNLGLSRLLPVLL